jgi:hypothetical protein
VNKTKELDRQDKLDIEKPKPKVTCKKNSDVNNKPDTSSFFKSEHLALKVGVGLIAVIALVAIAKKWDKSGSVSRHGLRKS